MNGLLPANFPDKSQEMNPSNSLILVLLALAAVALSACDDETSKDRTEATSRASGEPCEGWISGSEARRIVADGGLLLDVRSPTEYEGGHLPGATNIDVSELASRLDEVPKDKHVVVYCRSGKRSHEAALILERNGYEVSEIGTQAQYAPDAKAGCGES